MLVNDREGLRLETQGVPSEHVQFPAGVDKVKSLEIFVDRRVVEVYVNGGGAVGTKVFYGASGSGCFILHTDTPECISKADIFCMESIWKR